MLGEFQMRNTLILLSEYNKNIDYYLEKKTKAKYLHKHAILFNIHWGCTKNKPQGSFEKER